MGEKTLLVDIETEKKKQVERKLKQIHQETKPKEMPKQKRVSPFSASAFPSVNTEKMFSHKEETESEVQIIDDEVPDEEIEEKKYYDYDRQIETRIEEEFKTKTKKQTATIETPNYDTLETLSEEERIKVFKIEKEQAKVQPKPKKKRFRLVIAACLFALFGVWGIVNVVQINSVGEQITQVSSEYSINLAKYARKLKSLDATSSQNMNNLIETIPEAESGVTTIKEQSNWFDRFCSFLAGFFGI